MLSLAVHPRFLAELERLGFDFTKRRIAATARCFQLAMRIRQEALSGDDAVSRLEIEGLGMELCAEIFREHAKRIAGDSDWLARADRIIHDRFREQISLTELAAEVGVHPVHLARSFRKRYGRCIGEQIRQLRVDTACSELTHSQLPIVDISARSGFSDQSHFCRTFKRYVGVSPHQFRIGVPRDRNLEDFRVSL